MTGCALGLVFIPNKTSAFLRSGDNLGHIYLGGRLSAGERFESRDLGESQASDSLLFSLRQLSVPWAWAWQLD